MNIYVYSDESGVFDHIHNKYFVFAGVIILGDKEHDDWRRKYVGIENHVRTATGIKGEIKSTTLSNKYKGKIFRALNNCNKFAGIIEQWRVNTNIWVSKKDKQRYLDYAYKISVKKAFEKLVNQNLIIPEKVKKISFHVDEHTTATNGRYKLQESLEQEFKSGTYNYNYSKYFKPLFPALSSLTLDYCNSSASKNRLIRASDIIANKIYYYAVNENKKELQKIPCLHFIYQP
ncbi:MAG: DUF3800 domain-containing protein [Synergistaceae bacterium]|nr:DUF3800 domain-containing protein [Synergistaceae bacterium]